MAGDQEQQQQFKREAAVRIFAQEFSLTKLTVEKSESEKQDKFTPSYAYSPTGAKINRMFICGAMTEIEDIEAQGGSSFVRARVTDPTGTFHIMAGQYQPEVAGRLRELAGRVAEEPIFVSVIGKPNIYKPDNNTCYASIRAESINLVDEKTIDIWTAETATATIQRIKALKVAMNSNGSTAEEIKAVIAAYNPQIGELKNMVLLAIGKSTGTEQAPESTKPESKNSDVGVPEKPAEPAQDTNSPAQAELAKAVLDKTVPAAHGLLAELGALSEDGTVGATHLAHLMVQRKIALPDTAEAVIKEMMHRGFCCEPKIGRLRAV